ncbi:AfsR/SARP family transcriptional regulator [Rhizocola hellebori]|uniref:AfsR/SARP family transcriptional regulator n=1 Tax=Rhizocola hellebori TaxID=1392758 RepID=UPI0019417102|nr:hypothetical protein [Rhizocola hellebori]
MEFRILGPPEAATADGPVRLAGHRQRMVFAILLANAHRVVSVDSLVDALWEDRPPATARRQVRN